MTCACGGPPAGTGFRFLSSVADLGETPHEIMPRTLVESDRNPGSGPSLPLWPTIEVGSETAHPSIALKGLEVMTRILISALLLMYVGCATAGPQQVPPEYAHIQDFVAKASAAYGMDIPRIVATDWEDRAAIRYQDRQLYVSRKTLSYSDAILEPLLAHELGHHILGHRGSVSPQDEAAANAEAVRILAKL